MKYTCSTILVVETWQGDPNKKPFETHILGEIQAEFDPPTQDSIVSNESI